MNDIICPHCKKVFKADEAGFANILKQVRDHVFDKELHERLELAEKEKENAVKLAESNLKNTLQAELAKKDKELTELRAENDRNLAEKLAKKESELAEIKSKLVLWEADEDYVSKRECNCDSKGCRKKVTGKDWQLKEVQERYKNHFSPLINKRIRSVI